MTELATSPSAAQRDDLRAEAVPADAAQTGRVDVRAVLADVARLGPFFTVGTEPVAGERGWRPLAELHTDPEPLRSRIAHVRRVLDTDDRVAASIAFQGLAAQLVSPPFAAVVLHGVLPRLTARAGYWRPTPSGPWELRCPEPAGTAVRGAGEGAGALAALLVEEHLDPLVAGRAGPGRGVAAGVVGQRRLGGGRRQAGAGRGTAGGGRAGGGGGRPGADHGPAPRHRPAAGAAAAGPELDVPEALVLPVLPGPRRRPLRGLCAPRPLMITRAGAECNSSGALHPREGE